MAQKAAASKAVVDGIAQASEGVVKLGRGFSALGVVGEEEVQKITEALDQVQAVMGVAKGSIDIYRGIAGATGVAGGAASAAAPIAAAVAAIASVGVAAKIVHESLTGSAKNIDSWSMKIATWEAKVGLWVGVWDDGSEAVARATKRLNDQKKGNVRAEAVGQITSTGKFLKEDIRRQSVAKLVTSGDSLVNRQQALDNQSFINRKQRGRALFSAANDPTKAGRKNAADQVGTLDDELIGIDKQRLVLAKELRADRIGAAKAGVQGAQKELELTTQRLDQIKASLLSGKQRFGQLSDEDAAKTEAAFRKAQRGEGSTREDSNLLRAVGLMRATKFANEADEKRADERGFSNFLGQDETTAIAAGEQGKRAGEFDIKTKQEILVKVEQQQDAMVQSLVDVVNQAIVKANQDLEEKVQREVSRQVEVVNQMTDEQLETRFQAGAISE